LCTLFALQGEKEYTKSKNPWISACYHVGVLDISNKCAKIERSY
jgi:hypothetical protein